MNAHITYNDLPVTIKQADSDLRRIMSEAQMLTELKIYEPIMVTIRAADGSAAFPNPETHLPYRDEINVPVSALKFEFVGSSQDAVKIAGLKARQLNSQTGKELATRFPNLALQSDFLFEIETLRLYLISSRQASGTGPDRGTWNELEHTAQSWRNMNLGE